MSQPAQQPGWLDGLFFNVGDAFSAGDAAGAAMSNGGSSGGQGFTMSRDDASAMLNVAKAVRDDFDRMRRKAENLTQITSPADEPTSNAYNQRLVNQGEPKGVFVTGKERTDEAYAYADELVKRLEKALGLTESSDDQAAADVKNAGKQDRGFAG